MIKRVSERNGSDVIPPATTGKEAALVELCRYFEANDLTKDLDIVAICHIDQLPCLGMCYRGKVASITFCY